MKLSKETRQHLKGQLRRQRAYEEGVYELSEDEGFECVKCGWRGLSAPANLDADPENICYCPGCEGQVTTLGDETSIGEYIMQFVSTDHD